MMTKTVTRYRMEGRLVKCAPDDSEPYYADVEEVEALNGEWVKWEDVKPLLRAVEPLSEPVSHESEPHNIIQRYKAERTTLAQAIAEVRRYGEECARRAAEPRRDPLREALERIVALHDRVDLVEAQEIASNALNREGDA